MSQSTSNKERIAEREAKALSALAKHNKSVSENKSSKQSWVEVMGNWVQLFDSWDEQYPPINDFAPSGKHRNEGKQKLEYLQARFGKFAAPKWMFDEIVNLKDAVPRRGGAVNFQTIQEEQQARTTIMEWLICCISGGSLFKRHTKQWGLTRQETHILLTTKQKLDNWRQAVVFAVAFTESNNLGISFRISCSQKLQEEIFKNVQRWKRVIKWFCANTPNSHQEISDLSDYLISMPNLDVFGNGLTLESLSQRTKEWHWALRRLKEMGSATWEGMCVSPFVYIEHDFSNKVDRYWYLQEITDAQTLQKEGTKMRHCVYSYKQRCMNGESFIASLRMDLSDIGWKSASSKVTIEVKNRGTYYEVVQARGVANRLMTVSERHIVKKWATENGIFFSSYV